MKYQKAMKERSGDPSKEGDFRLCDQDQIGLTADSHGFYNNVMNPCVNGTKNFLELVTNSLWQYMEDFPQNLKHVHIGGNQVNLEVLEKSPACQAIMANRKISADEILHEFFQVRVFATYYWRNLNFSGMLKWHQMLDFKFMPGRMFSLIRIRKRDFSRFIPLAIGRLRTELL